MAAKHVQRWGILAILIVTVIGTLGSFAVMVLSQHSQSTLQAKLATAQENFTKEQTAYQKLQDAQADELSKQYYDTFSPYESQVGAFDISSVSEMGTEDVVVGEGEEVTGTTKFAAYYIGWDANGHVFDQSVDTTNAKLKAPLPIADGLDSASLITGWKEGMKGMHIGGVRVLTIPSDKAYGETGSKDSAGNETIAPNMPLKFVVMAITTPAAVPQTDAYTKALDAYQKAYLEYNGQ